MCGILGCVSNSFSTENMMKSLESLRHRGPDDQAVFQEKDIFLGMQRLAIIDIAKQHQPYFNEDRSCISIFNGEIYNHKKLRESLEDKKHIFESNNSDGEVILHLYEEFGLEFPKYLDGIFAIAIFDKKKNMIHLIRDHFGIKPLYYSLNKGNFIFASEMKAIKRLLDEVSPNNSEIFNFILNGNTVAPETAFNEIQQVQAANVITFNISNHNLTHSKYIDYQSFINSGNNRHIDLKDSISEIQLLLKKSVEKQIMSEVGFGSLLSGGVDSSAIAILASEFSKKQVDTYCAIYPELQVIGKKKDQDFARKVSTIIDSNHHEIPIRLNDLIENFDTIIENFDEPSSSVFANYFVSKEISKRNKVALTGDGSDELFGSYQSHRAASAINDFKNGVLSEKDFLNFVGISYKEIKSINEIQDAQSLQSSLWNINYSKIAKKVLSKKGYDDLVVHKKLLTPTNIDPSMANIDLLSKVLFSDLTDLLPNHILPYVDRLSMAHSVELRPPFLDSELVKFTLSLPHNWKIKELNTKYILGLAMKGIVPNEILSRKKEGFILPLHNWLDLGLRDWIRKKFEANGQFIHEYLDLDGILNILSQSSINYKEINLIWRMLIFNHWFYRNF